MAGLAKSLFLAALDVDSDADRRAYLDAQCGEDADLRREVEALLAAHAATGNPFDRPPAGLAAAANEETEVDLRESAAGERIDKYTLLQKLGEGGMGSVWAAEQHAPVRRRVALKLIKPGMDSVQVLRRFEAERQALALMDHPNIAKVFDAGTTAEGRPFFAMELVKGVPITKYCDELNLPLRERLDLFVAVCRAIQHAHTKGVVHRDVKPSNVLVAVEDGKAVPKVIDFGLAKALHQRLVDRTMYTELGAVIGTLEYMAPEQAELSALDVDTRADIYALGALLYELLTGSTPLDRSRLASAGLAEMMRIIREEEPPKPSTRLSDLQETLPSLAAHRRTEPSKLTREVCGDLDWIVMKCLEKDRARRYETANGLARDIERHLADEPVEARPPSRGYRLRKFTRRNKGPLAATALLAVTLVAGTTVATWQAIRATNAEALADERFSEADAAKKQAIAAQQTAVSEARKSEQVAAFMKQMLEGVGPEAALGRDTTMLRTILDDTRQRLDQLQDQPAVQVDLQMVLGDVYYDIGEYGDAETMYHAALDLRRELLGERHVDVASTLSEYGEAIRKQGRYDEAERLLTEALALHRELLGDDDPAVGLTLYRLGMLHVRRRDGVRAEAILREAQGIFSRHTSRDTNGRIIPGGRGRPLVLDQLGLSLQLQAKHAEAESLFREHLASLRQYAPGSPGLAYVLYNLAGTLRDQGKLAEAESCYREALEIRRKQLPADHIDSLLSMSALAWLLVGVDRTQEAVPLIDEFVGRANTKRTTGLTGIPLLIDRRLRHFQKLNDIDGCRTSAEMWERRNLSDAASFFEAARFRAVTAAVVRSTDRSPESRKIVDEEFGRAIDWLRKAVVAGYTDFTRFRYDADLAVLRDRKDFQELLGQVETNALTAARDAVRLQPKNPESHHVLATVLRQQKKWNEAETAFRDVLRLDPGFPGCRFKLADVLITQGKGTEAEAECREILRVAPRDAAARSQLGNALSRQQKWPEAEAAYREALEIRRKQSPPGHDDILWSMSGLATSLIACDRGEEALPLIDEFVGLAEGKDYMRDRITNLISDRLRHFQKVQDAAGCRTSAELWEKLNRNGPAFFFDAARYRAVTAAVLRSTDSSPEAGKSSDEEAGRAIEWLHKAVAAGYTDVTRLKQDVDLGVLRDREDFKSIIGGLEPKPEEVLAAAREAVHLKPDDAASHVGLGRALSAQSKLDEAAAAFREAVRLKPDFADAYEGLAAVLRTQRKWDEARALDLRRLDIQIRLANDAVAERPEDANAYRDRGVFLCRAGRFREAIPDLDKAIELDPGDHSKYDFAAPVHLYLGDFESYRRVCREAAKQFSSSPVPEVGERLAKRWLVEPDPAADLELCGRLAERAVAQGASKPYGDWLKVTHGLVEYRRGRFDQAAKTLERLPETGRIDSYGRGLAGLVLAMAHAKSGRTEQALQTLLQTEARFDALHIAPAACDLGNNYYGWCIYQVILREARLELSPLISARQQASLLLVRAAAMADEAGRAGRWREAAAMLEKSIEATADSSPAEEFLQWYRAANAWALAGDRVAYEGLCRRMLDRYGGSSDIQAAQLSARGSLLLPDVAHQDEAIRLAERAVTAAGDRAAPAYNLLTRSLAEYRAGRFEQAIEWNDAALARDDIGVSRRVAHQFTQVMSLSRLGRGDEARAMLSEALAATPAEPPSLIGDPIWELLRREAVALMPEEAQRPGRVHQ